MTNDIVPYEAALLDDDRGELRSAVGLLVGYVPMFGQILKELVQRGVRDREKHRLAKFLLGLYADLKRLEGQVRRDYAKKEEVADLLSDAVDRTLKDPEEKRRGAYRRIIADVLTTEGRTTDDARRLLRIVTELSVDHLRLLRCLEKPVEEGETRTANHFPVLLLQLVEKRLMDQGVSRSREVMADLEHDGVLADNLENILSSQGQVPSALLLTDRGEVLLKVTRADGQPA